MQDEREIAAMLSDRLLAASLRRTAWGPTIAAVIAAALAAVEPAAAVRHFLARDGDTLRIGPATVDLAALDRVLIVGIGKAAAPMARAAVEVLCPAPAVEDRVSGVIVTKDGYGSHEPIPGVEELMAGHPMPDERSVAAAERIAELLASTTERDLVLALISGGGSALAVLPAPGVSLADLQALTALLLAGGATIDQINTLRKHLDRIKGGGIVRLAAPARVAALILSDVVGNPLDVIASGPTVPDTSTYGDALATLAALGILERVTTAIRAHLERGERGEIPETLRPGNPLAAGTITVIVGSNALAAEAALAAAEAAGLHGTILTTSLQGEARQVGHALAAIAREEATANRPLARPVCLIAGGETTVTVRGDGMGGRNQELALAAAADLAGLRDVALVTLATDGGDGPTDAAGAVATGETLAHAQALGLDPAAYLARNDSYHFFAALDDLIRTGPTQTNVDDLAFIFAW
jgi:glycerate 2-kinase